MSRRVTRACQGDSFARMDLQDEDLYATGSSRLAVEVGTVVRPGRVRNRTKTETEEKVKQPADGVRKKAPPARKAPPRGRYVDEYARPAH